jgi:uncharacterized protein YbcI
MTPDEAQFQVRERSVLMEISNEMVRLYKELFGRGPTRARTSYAGSDALLCTLTGSFTPAEQSLVQLGEHERLRETRLFYQHAREQDFRDSIERITGRRVIAFMSAIDTVADMACELFYLEPLNGDGAQ